jgi:DNA-binding protein H-NS
MSDINLNAMSLPELKRLQKAIAKAIAAYSDRKKREALIVLEASAQEFGFSLADLMGGKLGGKKTRNSRRPAGPKYRHPENPDITWSGRGRQPGWFRAAKDAGITEEAMGVLKEGLSRG